MRSRLSESGGGIDHEGEIGPIVSAGDFDRGCPVFVRRSLEHRGWDRDTIARDDNMLRRTIGDKGPDLRLAFSQFETRIEMRPSLPDVRDLRATGTDDVRVKSLDRDLWNDRGDSQSRVKEIASAACGLDVVSEVKLEALDTSEIDTSKYTRVQRMASVIDRRRHRDVIADREWVGKSIRGETKDLDLELCIFTMASGEPSRDRTPLGEHEFTMDRTGSDLACVSPLDLVQFRRGTATEWSPDETEESESRSDVVAREHERVFDLVDVDLQRVHRASRWARFHASGIHRRGLEDATDPGGADLESMRFVRHSDTRRVETEIESKETITLRVAAVLSRFCSRPLLARFAAFQLAVIGLVPKIREPLRFLGEHFKKLQEQLWMEVESIHPIAETGAFGGHDDVHRSRRSSRSPAPNKRADLTDLAMLSTGVGFPVGFRTIGQILPRSSRVTRSSAVCPRESLWSKASMVILRDLTKRDTLRIVMPRDHLARDCAPLFEVEF